MNKDILHKAQLPESKMSVTLLADGSGETSNSGSANNTANEARTEQSWNARTGETGDPRENPPTSCIVRHYSHLRISGSDPARGIEPISPWWEASSLTAQTPLSLRKRLSKQIFALEAKRAASETPTLKWCRLGCEGGGGRRAVESPTPAGVFSHAPGYANSISSSESDPPRVIPICKNTRVEEPLCLVCGAHGAASPLPKNTYEYRGAEFWHVVNVTDADFAWRVFPRFSRLPPLLHSAAAPYLSRFTLIGSQDLGVNSRSNLSTTLQSPRWMPFSSVHGVHHESTSCTTPGVKHETIRQAACCSASWNEGRTDKVCYYANVFLLCLVFEMIFGCTCKLHMESFHLQLTQVLCLSPNAKMKFAVQSSGRSFHETCHPSTHASSHGGFFGLTKPSIEHCTRPITKTSLETASSQSNLFTESSIQAAMLASMESSKKSSIVTYRLLLARDSNPHTEMTDRCSGALEGKGAIVRLTLRSQHRAYGAHCCQIASSLLDKDNTSSGNSARRNEERVNNRDRVLERESECSHRTLQSESETLYRGAARVAVGVPLCRPVAKYIRQLGPDDAPTLRPTLLVSLRGHIDAGGRREGNNAGRAELLTCQDQPITPRRHDIEELRSSVANYQWIDPETILRPANPRYPLPRVLVFVNASQVRTLRGSRQSWTAYPRSLGDDEEIVAALLSPPAGNHLVNPPPPFSTSLQVNLSIYPSASFSRVKSDFFSPPPLSAKQHPRTVREACEFVWQQPNARFHHRGSKLHPGSDLRSTQETVAPFEFRAGLAIEMKFISNRRNWPSQISTRDQQPSSTNQLVLRSVCGDANYVLGGQRALCFEQQSCKVTSVLSVSIGRKSLLADKIGGEKSTPKCEGACVHYSPRSASKSLSDGSFFTETWLYDVRILSHGEEGLQNTIYSHALIPGRVTGFSQVGIVPDDAVGGVGFLGDLPFPPPPHSGAAPYSLQSPSSALKTSLSDAGKGWRTGQEHDGPEEGVGGYVSSFVPPNPSHRSVSLPRTPVCSMSQQQTMARAVARSLQLCEVTGRLRNKQWRVLLPDHSSFVK
ncbi:hypothetical protein PR048_024450 [Dryococelus australis]|uniref:Uncharacterized protein n=1 Tax=Dryococelus australis TaxID=614101 RepID=A0ABQ9GNM4_9NEOP|nr:hypothetical protein PR048_024450 [Dryococelus australis]